MGMADLTRGIVDGDKYYKLADGKRKGYIVVQRAKNGLATETLASRFHNLGGNLMFPKGASTAIRLRGLKWVDPSHFDIDVTTTVETQKYIG